MQRVLTEPARKPFMPYLNTNRGTTGACSGQYDSIEFRTAPEPQDFTVQHWYYQYTSAFCSFHVLPLPNLMSGKHDLSFKLDYYYM